MRDVTVLGGGSCQCVSSCSRGCARSHALPPAAGAALLFAALLIALVWPAAAIATPERVGSREAIEAANRDAKVVEERREHPNLGASASRSEGHWEVAYFAAGKEVAVVLVDPHSGEVLESWTGYQVAWKMARG